MDYCASHDDRDRDACQDIFVTKYIIIGIHGLGGRAAWLNRIQEELEKFNAKQTEHQFIWHAHDLPGFGANGDGHIRSFHDWLKSVQDEYEALRVANPGAKFVIFGHSLGGVIASNLYEIHEADALILSVPGFKGAKTTFNPWFVARVLITYVISSQTLISMPSPNTKKSGMIRGKLYNGDPTDEDIYKTKEVSANLLWQILQLGKHSERNLSRLRRNPVLLVQVAEDPVVDNNVQDNMLSLVDAAQSNKIIIPGNLHDWPLYDGVIETVPKIVEWVLKNG